MLEASGAFECIEELPRSKSQLPLVMVEQILEKGPARGFVTQDAQQSRVDPIVITKHLAGALMVGLVQKIGEGLAETAIRLGSN